MAYPLRGNELGLKKFRVRYDLRKYSFTNRVANIWNSLPNKVVLADSVNCFKSRLDKFWQNEDIVYNFRAEIEGTGKRSEVQLVIIVFDNFARRRIEEMGIEASA